MKDTPLHRAARAGDITIVQLLADTGAPLGALNAGDATPLHVAACCGHAEAARVLLSAGAAVMVNLPDARGATPLHYAAANGQLEVTKVLAAAGGSLTARDRDGKSPVDLGIEYKMSVTEPSPRLVAPATVAP